MTNLTTSQIIAAAKEAADEHTEGTKGESAWIAFIANLERLAKEPEPARTLPHEWNSYPAVDVCKHCGREARVGDAGVDAEICPKRPLPSPPELEAGGQYGGHEVFQARSEAQREMNEALKNQKPNSWGIDAAWDKEPGSPEGVTRCVDTALRIEKALAKPTNIFLNHVPGAVVTSKGNAVGEYLGMGLGLHKVKWSDEPHVWSYRDDGLFRPLGENTSRDITHIAAAEVKGEEREPKDELKYLNDTLRKFIAKMGWNEASEPKDTYWAPAGRIIRGVESLTKERDQLTRDLAEARAETVRVRGLLTSWQDGANTLKLEVDALKKQLNNPL